ncbi:MAG: alpha/beta hydrolase [Candidatus Omnitrophica bacterium]|nr:alpha/beta hydrolase [Candidatus Omnitrophota bacterium]
MVVLEVLFLICFWTWALSALLFLWNTLLPRLPLSRSPATLGLSFDTVRFQATDGVWLSGWMIPADPRRTWLILCHGLGTNRADLLDIASALVRARYNVLLFDFRAHGDSQGRATSFGWREQRDLEGALVFLGKQPSVTDRPYGVLGVSMGGSVALTVSATDERIGAVVADSSYTNLGASLDLHVKLLYHLPRIPWSWFLSSTYRARFGVFPKQMSPLDSVGKISPRPILLIYGQNDRRVPVEQANQLFQAAREPRELWMVDHAGHLEALHADPSAYLRRVVSFFNSFLNATL